MTPTASYKLLNRLLWRDRLPKATILLIENTLVPSCYGLTIHDDIVVRPVIFLNSRPKHWGKTLVHELIHVAEPELRHGKIFDALVDLYWQRARKEIKGLR